MKNLEINFYFKSSRPKSRWIGLEFSNQDQEYYLEFGFFFFYLSISYDRYTKYTEL
jgi:hypothetical protein